MSERELMEATVREEEEEEDEEEEEEGREELTLLDILTLYNQPINEEQAWAVCYQCCRTLAEEHSVLDHRGVLEGPGDVRMHKNGTVRLHTAGKGQAASSAVWVIESLGIMIYKALDYGLKENEERELSPPLEQLIDLMTNTAGTDADPCPDEGYEATEEEEEEGRGCGSGIRRYRDVLKLCTSHLPSPADAPAHYQAVCRALYAETMELRTFLDKIRSAKEVERSGSKSPIPQRWQPLPCEGDNSNYPALAFNHERRSIHSSHAGPSRMDEHSDLLQHITVTDSYIS